AMFTLGSVAGLVTFSHVLNYVLHNYKSITIASIIGFIIGSLGVVWPWKHTLYKTADDGSFVLDSRGEQIISHYERFLPELTSETFIAIAYVLLGILIVLALEWYGKRTKQIK
ncbi:MAG: DUF368 domain-containing protein, partial [Psychroserpens sp.]|nr:DUF368 domain-containing protein [Psychroserpens sp.]